MVGVVVGVVVSAVMVGVVVGVVVVAVVLAGAVVVGIVVAGGLMILGPLYTRLGGVGLGLRVQRIGLIEGQWLKLAPSSYGGPVGVLWRRIGPSPQFHAIIKLYGQLHVIVVVNLWSSLGPIGLVWRSSCRGHPHLHPVCVFSRVSSQ